MCSNLQPSQVLRRFLVIFIYLHVCFIVEAKGSQGGDERVTIVAKNTPLRNVFKSITKQTGLYLFYSPEVVNVQEKVTLDVRQQPVDAVLTKILEDKGLVWIYNGNAITIRTKEKEEKKRISSVADSTTNPIQIIVGKVMDANGNAIPGATILVKGTKEGATTDPEGNFSLPNVHRNDWLQVSSIGFETREMPVQGSSMQVKLNVVVNDLDETVVIAYGKSTKRMLTGNISSIKAEEIEKQPVSNPLAALQGRVPGMVITQQTGVPGGSFTVAIRGRNSIRAEGNDPLYIIDGVPYPSSFPSSNGSAIIGQGSPFNFLNPADIASIDVLKDADATAIYGSRGANGVILITTKKGTVGNMKLTARYYTGVGKVPKRLDLLNLGQYLQMKHEAFQNDGAVPGASDYAINGAWDTTKSTDWQRELIGGTANYTDAQASISGGTDMVQYVVSSGYHRETTVFPGSANNNKGSVHFNLNGSSPNKKLNLLISGSYVMDNNRLPTFDLTPSIFLPPNAPALYTSDGKLNWQNSTWNNPLSPLYKEYNNNTDNLTANVTASYEILKSLEFKTSVGYSKILTNAVNTNPKSANDPAFNTPRTARFEDNKFKSTIVEPQLNYKNSFGKNKFSVLLGGTLLHNRYTGRLISASGYATDELLKSVNGASSISVYETQNKEYKYAAVFGRLNYEYDGKYIVNLTGRYDGSSRFGPGKRSHFFHAVGMGWLFSREKFIQENLGFLTLGKLRFSYGETGNDQIADYGYLDLYSFIDFLNPYQGTQGLVPVGLLNDNYSWEVNKKLEVGLELSMFNDRIYISTSYFRNRSSNQLIGYTLPTITGFGNVIANRPALVQNKGYEIVITSSNINNGKFRWNTSFNISTTKNKLLEYPNLEGLPEADFFVIGESLNILKRYKFSRVNPETGIYEFIDAQGKPTSKPSYATDRVAIVDRMPKFYGGLQNTVSYRSFSLDFLFQFVKQNGYDSELFGVDAPGRLNTYNPSQKVLERWQKPGDQTTIQKFTQSGYGNASQAYYFASQSDRAYIDASFIRLKNVSLSYEFPKKLKERVRVDDLKVFFQAQNLLTITGYKGLDPETQSVTSLPPLRVLTIGAQITL